MKARQPAVQKPQSSRPGQISRRELLGGAAAAAALAIVPRHVLGGPGHVPPSEKITLAGIGVGGQGMQNMVSFLQFPEVQVTAVCDVNRESGGYISWNWTQGKEQKTAGREPARRAVDEYYAQEKGSGKYRGCRAYHDYRELLAKEKVDAVMVATPDHAHAVITMAALKLGKHVYCEKPLAYTVHETRQVTEAARQAGVATQLGNHGQATEEARADLRVHHGRRHRPGARGARFVAGPFLGACPCGPAVRRKRRRCRTGWIGTCGSVRPPSGPTIRLIARGPGATGGISARGCWATWAATSSPPCSRPSSWASRSASRPRRTLNNGEVYPFGVIARYEFPARGDMPPTDAQLVRRRIEAAATQGPGAANSMGDVMYIGEKGTLMGHRLVPEAKMKSLRPPAEETRPLARPLQGVRRRLPRRPAGGRQLRRSRRPVDRDLHAGQRGPARRQQTPLGRP